MNEMPRPPVNAQRARQGRQGSRVLLILIAALALLAVVWVAVEIFGAASETPQTRDNPSGISPSTAEQASPLPSQ